MRLGLSFSLGCLCLLALPSCSAWLFSGETWVDRTRPAILVETTGGVEFGAATEFGVLTLGRTATDGPCRVHYFLGPTPLVESGTISPTTSVFSLVDIDLKTQAVRVLDRSPTRADRLVAMWTPGGANTVSVPVQLAHAPNVTGDLLQSPDTELPAGACLVHTDTDGTVLFVGLVAGKAKITDPTGVVEYYVFAGVDRIRELLAMPQPHPVDLRPRYRPDDITVLKPVAPAQPARDPPPK